MTLLRSILFLFSLLLLTPPFSLIALLTFPLPALLRFRVISYWSRIALWLLRVLCGIRYEVRGREHIPATPAIILSKHQSAWETLAFQQIFPPHVWVMKRSLLLVPFLGWGLAMLRPIAIDRDAGREALKQVTDQGRDRLKRGLWIVIFPEGTRVVPGNTGRYGIGGAWLATHSGAQVLPVAHNAGEFWGRNTLRKLPGTITVSIGAPIDPAGMKPAELNEKVQAWIETEMLKIQAPGAGHQASGEVGARHASPE
ncbi:MAG: 1-acyl-sn-glycerol-3-phosphate acyltransferase [Hydrogenophilales bacterium]|nr:1-acyl-sn-glycerol-3-phosphate acyltransferase [Hydrogenophilales bacterium]